MIVERRVLVVDDNASMLEVIPHLLGPGFQTFRAVSGEAARARLVAGQAFDVLLCDVLMPPPLDGLGLLQWVRGHRPESVGRWVFMTIAPEFPAAREIALGHPVLRKPFTRAVLLAVLEESWPGK